MSYTSLKIEDLTEEGTHMEKIDVIKLSALSK